MPAATWTRHCPAHGLLPWAFAPWTYRSTAPGRSFRDRGPEVLPGGRSGIRKCGGRGGVGVPAGAGRGAVGRRSCGWGDWLRPDLWQAWMEYPFGFIGFIAFVSAVGATILDLSIALTVRCFIP